MLLTDVLAMLRRQWIATLAVLATTAGVGLLVINTTPTAYESDAVVAVLPTSGGNPDANPYFTSPEALSELASLTIQIMESPQKKAALEAAGVPTYTLENEQSSSSRSAAIFVTVEGSSPDDAAANAATVVRQTSAELEGIQTLSTISKNAQAAIFTVVEPEAGTPQPGARYKAGVAAGFAVLFFGMIFVAVMDTIRRRKRTSEAASPDGDPDPRPLEDELTP